jgi:hypothetical protein
MNARSYIPSVDADAASDDDNDDDHDDKFTRSEFCYTLANKTGRGIRSYLGRSILGDCASVYLYLYLYLYLY